ncbi:putative transferase, protein kinase RLK-Pelle-LRR-IX family [Helianthus annuus]|nr:putative transferase, protein kinase RLK-Pelle-LRR-IX family [Helianthus annuus]
MAHHFLLFINFFFFFFLLISFSTSDDASFMSKLSTSISPTPSTWRTDDFCVWEGIKCDNTRHVTAINLVSKSLTGTLPSNLNSLSQLKTLSLQRNSLSGNLPTLANLTFLTEVYLDANNFTSIPSNFFLGLTNLQTFSISDNLNLSPWSLPNDLSQSTNLQSFQASNANVNGFIPDIFDSFPSFQSLRLSHNNLTGTLPATFGGSGIQNLWLDNQLQGLSGTLDVISSMAQLYQVWLQANAFTGAIPDLSKCINLFDLQLSHNQLTGVVPSSLISLPKLANVTLQKNKLQGPLPVFQNGVRDTLGLSTNRFCLATPGNCDPQVTALLEVAEALGYPMLLAESWEGNNACANWHFISCDSSGKNVTALSFSNMKFSGTISPSFGKLTSLRSLSLKNNNLIGSIPEILTSLPDLQLLDVSNNNLSGLVPEFPQKVRVVLDNNLLLGEDIHNGSIKPPDSTPNSSASGRSPTQHSQRKLVSAGMIVGIVISILVFIWIVSYICYYKFYRVPTKLHSQVSRHHNHTPSYENGSLMISIQVLDQVTDNFSDNNVLGRGGFGVVYKGQFDDGSMIAVKRMKLGTKGIKEFQAEIGVLTKVRHRHLVAFLGYCINGNERLLVYEYMEQGTLSQHLFEWRKHKTPPLSWRQRVSIALDVGRGVEYLHSLAQQRFIHRDLKPANILLDGDMRAKVADFGLVKIVLDGKHSVDTRLAGTFGYLPPEYAGNGRVTRKVDVYAYGVVLMELVTGRKAVDETMSDESCHLATWFRRVPLLSKENMVNCIDQVLNIDDVVTLESIVKVAELAVHCTACDPFQRPDMSYVVNVLGPLVERWEPSQQEDVQTYHGHHTSLPRVLQANEDTSSMSSFNDFQANSV